MADACLGNLRCGPFPHGQARVASFHRVVQVVPVVQQPEVVERLLLHVHAGARLSQRFRPLQGVHAESQAGFGAGVDVTGAAGVIDVEPFGRQSRVDGGLNGGEDLLVGFSGGEPEVRSVLFHGLNGRRAGGEKDSRQDSERNCAHNGF